MKIFKRLFYVLITNYFIQKEKIRNYEFDKETTASNKNSSIRNIVTKLRDFGDISMKTGSLV